jgi:Protein of unknown function (DUF4232)
MFTMRTSVITRRRMLVASCVIPAAAFIVAGCGSAGPGAAPTKTVTVTTTPSSPTTTAPAAPGTSQCTTADLRLSVGASNGAAGTIYYPLDFTNTSSTPCMMYGYPGVAFVSSPGGSQVGAAAGRSSTAPALVTLAPGATAHATLMVSDALIGSQCPPGNQVQVSTVQVYPPDQYSALSAPLSRQGCADQSLVTMNVDTVTSGP